MKIHRIAFILALLLVFNSCNSLKVAKLMTRGEVIQTNFDTTIPYEKFRNWMLVDVKVNGSSKTYKFLFDSGAVTLITPELAKTLGLKAKASQSVGSSTNQKRKTGFTRIDNINIGGIDFKDIGAVIIGLDQSPDMKCLGEKVDGFIGANLMKHAIWQIDYQKHTLQFTDNPENITIGEKHYTLPFEPTTQATPKIKVPLFGKKVKASFDTGKSGGIGLNKRYFKNIDFDSDSVTAVRGYGVTGSGIFGTVEDTMHIVRINDFKWHDFTADTMYMSVAAKSSNLVGNQFFKNFRVTVNWQNNTLKLEPNATKSAAEVTTFGYGYSLKDDKLFLTFILENSPAYRAKIPLGSQILAINDKNLETVTAHDYCLIKEDGLPTEGVQEIILKYKTPDGEVKDVTLIKKQLL